MNATGFRNVALWALCACASVAPAAAQPDSMDAIMEARTALEQISWLSGHWEADHAQLEGVAPAWTESYWSEPRGAIMIGFSRRGQGLRLGSWELVRIQGDDAGRLQLLLHEDGGPPLSYPLVRASADEAVFENPAQEFPQRIAYRRLGDRLIVDISQMDGSGADRGEFQRRTGGRAPSGR